MTNDVINAAEEQNEEQSSAVETTNQTSDANAAAEDNQPTAETSTETSAAEASEESTNDETAETETSAETATAETASTETETAATEPASTETAQPAEPEKTETVKAETAKTEPVSEPSTDSAETKDAGSEVDFGAILEQYESEQITYHNGQIVEGKVVDVSDRGVLIDFGYKSEGIAPLDEFPTENGEPTVKKGDEVEVVIRNIASNDAPPMLSYSAAQHRVAWDTIEKAHKEDETIIGKITEKTKGGLKVDVGGVEAFLPGSQVDSRPVGNLDDYIGQDIETKVIRFSRKRNNIVLSRKVITDEVINAQKAETLGNIEEGYVVEGTVTNLTDYGAFVDIGGIDGLLHVTDMTWGRIQNPSDLFKNDEKIQVKILKLDRTKEEVSLGYKQLLPDPWESVEEFYPIGSRINGKVSSVTDYGAFIELEPGVEGLVHISEMSWSKRVKHPKHIARRGDDVEVQVLDIDPEDRRISLGIKQLQPNPWDTVGERFQVGDKVRGQVRNLTDFGAFVEIEDGIEGLVHISDISWSKKIKHPKDVLKKGQDIDAVITRLSPENRKISLSIKELTPSAWESFVATHKPGDVVKGKISRFAGFGVFVELADDLEGLCHISELSDERIENPESAFSIGQELEFKILRIEQDVEKIGLSHRAVGKEDEPTVDTKSYSTQAKGGMASLGELANLKFGSKTETAKEEPKEEEAETVEETAVEETAVEETPADDTVTAEETEQPSAETAEETAEETTETTEDVKAEDETPADDEATEEADTATAEETSTETEAATEETSEADAETVETAEETTSETETETSASTGEAENAETEPTAEADADVEAASEETVEDSAKTDETAEAEETTAEADAEQPEAETVESAEQADEKTAKG
ncbi:MAG: 30S ribosomal protein S1 [Pyrinomonadaceae bacterium]